MKIPEEIKRAQKRLGESLQEFTPKLAWMAEKAILDGIEDYDWERVADGYLLLAEVNSRLHAAIKWVGK